MATEEEDMARLAEEAARELLHAMPVLATDEPIARSAKALDAEQGSAARLKAALQEDTSFGNLRGGWVRQRGGFTMPLSGYELPHLLINGVIGVISPPSLSSMKRGRLQNLKRARLIRTRHWPALR